MADIRIQAPEVGDRQKSLPLVESDEWSDLQAQISDLWKRSESLPQIGSMEWDCAERAVTEAVDLLDSGKARVAEVGDDGRVVVNGWLKQAILLRFSMNQKKIKISSNGNGYQEYSDDRSIPFSVEKSGIQSNGNSSNGVLPIPIESYFFEFEEYTDKLPIKSKTEYEEAGVRAVPGAVARRGSFLDRGVIMMPSFVNIGARVGANTMIDTWATVGSCAQIGANVHLSGGVGIGGVLEPPQSVPVVVGDFCMVGSRCVLAEGARLGDGVVLGAGCVLTGSIPVFDAATGKELGRGSVPDWSVAVSATRRRTFDGGTFGLPCVLVVRRLEEGKPYEKAQLNSMLREYGSGV